MGQVVEHVKGSGQVYADGQPVFTADFEFTLRTRDTTYVPAMGGPLPVKDDGRDFSGWVRPNDGTDQFTATYKLSGKSLTVDIGGGRLVPFMYGNSGWSVALTGAWPDKK